MALSIVSNKTQPTMAEKAVIYLEKPLGHEAPDSLKPEGSGENEGITSWENE
jgi:hypothetical protein